MRILIILIFLSPFIVQAQGKEVAVKGTKVSLTPPADFIPATSFNGFQQEASGSSIMVNELPTPYAKIITAFNTQDLATKGMTLVEKKELDWHNQKATFVKVTQLASGQLYYKQMLIFGDAAKTILINAIYPESAKSLETDLNKAILSTRYNEKLAVKQDESIRFIVDVKNTPFKFTKLVGGTQAYTIDGKLPTENPEKTSIVISGSLGGQVAGDRKQFSIERFKKLPGADSTVIWNINPVVIDGLNGYEITGGHQTKNGAEVNYQVMLYTTTGEYYIIVGSTYGKIDEYLPMFKQIAKTFKRK